MAAAPLAPPVPGAPAAVGTRRRVREALFWLVLVALVAAVSEGTAALATRMLVARGAMAEVPRLSGDEIGYALAHRSPLLGWGPETDGAGHVTALAPRPDPAFPGARRACVSVYGDSFTLGGADDATYPHALAGALGCPVANFGVGGYGSDQALMLFRAQRTADRSPVVVLGHLTENVMRNVNQYQRLLYPASRLRFKPRFLLDGDVLRWLSSPVATAADYRRAADAPESVLAHDAFLARPRPGFPYTVTLLRWIATDSYARSRLLRRPWHAAFYRPDDGSGALALTTEILRRFAAEARADGREPLVVVIPTRSDLDFARRTGTWVETTLVGALRDRSVPVVDAGPLVLARIAGADLGPLFVADGHPSAAGYALLGDVLAAEIDRLGLATIARAGWTS
jgi:hypothetical protein